MTEQIDDSVQILERELIYTRVLDAPRELVFDVWTKQEHLDNWWGADGVTITTQKMEVKPGGEWIYTMRGPDGRDYSSKTVFIEVKRPELLTYRQSGEMGDEHIDFHVTVNFEESGGKTKLTWRSVFDSAEVLNRIGKEYGAIEGGKQNLNRLREYLKNIKE